MAHSVKIEDKLYEKLRAYCNINGISVTKLCNDAITDYLNMIKFGDAPFLIADKLISERQAAEEISEILTDKVNELTKEDKYHDDDGKLIITPVSAEDGEKQLTEFLSTHTYDEFVKKEEPKEEEVKPKRPGKRRL